MREAPHAPLTSAAIAVSGSYASGVAALGADSDHVRWISSQAVVTLPGHIDVSNASQICEELLSVINHGATELIADMTATVSCEHAGAAAVARAYQSAAVHGAQLRLVVTAQTVRRQLTVNGLDQLIPVYPSLGATTPSCAPGSPAAARSTPLDDPEGTGSVTQARPHIRPAEPEISTYRARHPGAQDRRRD